VKLRLRYAKQGKVRFTSHRDTARIWERALRRADIPVATSSGFTPRPRISFGLALPTGAESVAEYLDIEVVPDGLTDQDGLAARLDAVLPTGFTVVAAAALEHGAGSLQEIVTSVTWELSAPEGVDVTAATAVVLAAAELPLERERKGERRVDDVRPAIRTLEVRGRTIVADLATVGRALRPAELAAVALPGIEPTTLRALRTHQWIDHDGDRREVLALPDVVAAPLAGA
jgi:radical SAM-linked protein